MNETEQLYADVNRKSPTHSRYLEMLSTFQDEAGISLTSNKQEIIDYLDGLIRENMSSIRMKDVKVLVRMSCSNLEAIAENSRTTLEFNPEVIAEIAYKLGSFLNFSINNSITLTKSASLLGAAVLMGLESPTESRRIRNLKRVKVGTWLLYLVRDDKKVDFKRESPKVVSKKLAKDVKVVKKKNRNPYKIKVVDESFALKLGLAFYYPDKDKPTHTQPLLEVPWKWKKFYHPLMGEMVRNTVEGVDQEFTLDKSPKIYEFMNKIRKVSFKVNDPLLSIFEQCVDDAIMTHEKKDYSLVQRQSILDQQEEIFRLADLYRHEPEFWLASFLDFRGRFYYSNTYFHPQGNKIARSLYMFAGDGRRIGKKGWRAMLAAAASENGQDKLSFEDKYKYARARMKPWMECAANPMACKGTWQTADNPWGFLSIIMEIFNAYVLENKYSYKSTLPIFIDASNSGTQILSALGRDEVGGLLSNLIPSEVRGDVYLYTANIAWKTFTYTEQEEKLYNEVHGEVLRYQEIMDTAYEEERWDDLTIIRDDYSAFYEANKEALKTCARVFWAKHEDLRRKLCKRPVMTIPYSAGVRTISRTLYKDWRPEPELKGITSTYCFELATEIVKVYNEHLEIPTKLMGLFIKLGLKAYKKKQDLTFRVPQTGFYFAQNARKDKIERLEIKRNRQRIQLNVCVGQNETIDYDSVKSASAPNVIHALDAALMMMIVKNADYPMMVIHDSFATYPGAYKKLHKNVRKSFVKMFEGDVLKEILLKCNAEELLDTIEYGKLDINGILENEYAFSV